MEIILSASKTAKVIYYRKRGTCSCLRFLYVSVTLMSQGISFLFAYLKVSNIPRKIHHELMSVLLLSRKYQVFGIHLGNFFPSISSFGVFFCLFSSQNDYMNCQLAWWHLHKLHDQPTLLAESGEKKKQAVLNVLGMIGRQYSTKLIFINLLLRLAVKCWMLKMICV